jgi:hypothetical protein
MNWYRAKEICGNCRDDYDCTEADMRCCCKLCRFLGNDDRCDDCRPVEEVEE